MYRTRDGLIIGPLSSDHEAYNPWQFSSPWVRLGWDNRGRYFNRKHSELDLVEELPLSARVQWGCVYRAREA